MSDRVWRTADGRYVGDGHPDAEILAAGAGDPRPDDFNEKTFEPGPTPADWADEVEPEKAEPEAEAEPDDEVEPEKATTVSVGKPATKPTPKHKK